MAKKNVNLTLANIEKEESKLREKKAVYVTSPVTGTTYNFTMDKHVTKSLGIEMVSEMLTNMAEARKKGLNLTAIIEPYTIMMLIKKFTSLGNDIPNDIGSQVVILGKLINLDILNGILEHFDQKRVQEVFDDVAAAIQKSNDEANKLFEEIEEAQDEFILNYDKEDEQISE
ncbi:hypothetical protein M5X17_27460 [Paenibacillus alvei]|uniref:hypothetical protein n=1 Tax=Paenibacillus alvei TaxID=44250 RepID=UPI00227F5898|nr:hypothetical protein [Paenibacillus alvei]MCY9737443.1 hypothetical protein [Paenibacillus alvei]